jgi:hypothetical protein
MRLKSGTKERFTEPYHSFAANAHKRYIIRHCINIVFILQEKTHINGQ